MLVKMTKIQIIGTRDVLDRTVRTLHRAGVVQIEEKLPAVDPLAMDESSTRQKDETAQLAARLDALLAAMPKRTLPKDATTLYEKEAACTTEQVIADVKAALTRLDAPAQGLAKKREALEADKVTLPRYAQTMHQLMPLAADMAPMKNYDTVALLIEKKSAAIIDLLRQQVASVTGDQYELTSQDIDKDTTAALIVYPREFASPVQSLLGRESITQVRLPEELTNISFREALTTIETRLAAIPAELAKIDKELSALADEWRTRLTIWSAVLHDRQSELDVRGKFGATQYTFVIAGWIPSRDVPALEKSLHQEVGDRILLTELELDEHEREHGPVVLSNPPIARPFEFLVRLMALPRYGTIDPTPIMAIFLPIFFGMILGDVAYGIIVLALALYLFTKAKPGGMKALVTVIIYCSIWSIVFGAIYGEFFGEFGIEILKEEFGIVIHPLFPRGEAVVALFAFSIAVGVVQIGLGFALGLYQAAKLHQRHELLDRGAKVIALIGIFMMVATMQSWLPNALFTPGLVLLLVGTVLLMYTIGWIGLLLAPIEIIGVVGNILSYLRLAAIGLSSVYLALVANKLAGIFGNIIIGIIIAALFHALNIALGILSPTIQSLRLHYVEFFGKFYEGGGVDFKPFKRAGMQ